MAPKSAFVELFGEKLQGKDGSVDTDTVLSEKKAVAVYFSAHWCPPCRGFTPKLAEWYTKDLKNKGLEVVFVSSDRDEDSFKGYFAEQPWLALPYDACDKKASLSKKYGVSGIPSLVILNAEGKIITKDGREAVSSDPEGKEFPWKKPTMAELMGDLEVLKNGESDEKVSLKTALEGKKALALYFSAHWCPPCRGFTPKLAEWYKNDLQAKGLEVLFVSSDRDEDSFKGYYKEQPWLALPFADRKTKDKLSQAMGVSGIPTLVILDPTDFSVINKDGRSAIGNDPTGLKMPWVKAPVGDLVQDGPGDLNIVTTVCMFVEGKSGDEQAAFVKSVEPLAKTFLDKAKAEGEETPEMGFVVVTKYEGLALRLRAMMKLGQAAPKNELKEAPSEGRGWGCDGCGRDHEDLAEAGVKGRYRDDETDFDFCGECYNKYKDVKVLKLRLAILDIPDEGGYYTAPEETELTAENVQKFVDDYKNGKLERQQLA